MFDLIIVGGGPAGVSAAVYAARKRLKTVLITDDWGGQSTVSPEIQNWIGETAISGADLAKKLKTHDRTIQRRVAGDRFSASREIDQRPPLETGASNGANIEVTTTDGKLTRRGRSWSRRAPTAKLEVPGAAQFDNKGVTYCASCDGLFLPTWMSPSSAVGMPRSETAMQLLAYCKTVTMVIRGDTFRADELTVEKVLQNPKMKVLKNTEILAVEGEKFVNGLRTKDAAGAESVVPVSGIFVEIGLIPNTEWLGDIVKKHNSTKSLPTHIHKKRRTSASGPRAIVPTANTTKTTSHQATR